jgi:hypothetical protein
MDRFIKQFVRDDSGAWVCVAPAELRLPQGRIQVTPGSRFAKGTKFMNIDVAALLDSEWERHRPR